LKISGKKILAGDKWIMPTASITDAATSDRDKRQNPGGGALYQMRLQNNPQDLYIYDEKQQFESQSKKRYSVHSRVVKQVDFSLIFGGKTVVKIPNDYDALGGCHLEVHLPCLQTGTDSGVWLDNLGTLLIRKLTLKFGECTLFSIERLYKDIMTKLTSVYSREESLRDMAGCNKKLNLEHIIIIPLNLFDLRNSGKYHFLPTYTTQQEHLCIEFETEDLQTCIDTPSDEILSANAQFLDAKLVCEYISFDPSDRNAMMYQPRTFLVDRLADSEADTDVSLSDGTLSTTQTVTVPLNEINFPVFFLAFVAYKENTLFEYLDIVRSYSLLLDGVERIRVDNVNEHNVSFYQNFSKNSSHNIGIVPFSVYASSIHPSGHCDFSKYKKKELKFLLKRRESGIRLKVFVVGCNYIRYEHGFLGSLYM